MLTPYKDLELSSKEIMILKYLKTIRKIKRTRIDRHEQYKFLIKYSLIDYADKERLYYALSDKGRMLLRYRKKDNFRFWLPIIISLIAITISFISLYFSLVL